MDSFYFSCNLCSNFKAGLYSEYNASQHLITHHLARDLNNLALFIRDCKFASSVCSSMGTSFYKLLSNLRTQVTKMTSLENGMKILDIMDLFLLPTSDGFDALADAIVMGCPDRTSFPTVSCTDFPTNSTFGPALPYQPADCVTFPDMYFGSLDPRIILNDEDSVLPPVPSVLLPVQPPLPQTSAQPKLPFADCAAGFSCSADVDLYMLKKESILKTRTNFLFRKLNKLNDDVLKRTALLDIRERRLIEDRTAFDEYMLKRQQTFAAEETALLDFRERRLIEDRTVFEEYMLKRQQTFAEEEMASSAYVSEQLNDSLALTYAGFSAGK